MADKELRKMNRTELIEIIYALQQNERALREENARLQAQLDDKVLRIERAGSIAEAALSLNHIFEDAEQAARQYLTSIQEANGSAEQILEDARRKAEAILAEAEAREVSPAQRSETAPVPPPSDGDEEKAPQQSQEGDEQAVF